MPAVLEFSPFFPPDSKRPHTLGSHQESDRGRVGKNAHVSEAVHLAHERLVNLSAGGIPMRVQDSPAAVSGLSRES